MIGVDAMALEVKARMGNRTDLDSRIIRWLNYAYLELLMNPRLDIFALDAEVTFSISSASNRYDIANFAVDLWFILSMRNLVTKRKIYRMHWSQADKLAYNADDYPLLIGDTQHGEPLRYYRYGQEIFFDPAPDDTGYFVKMRYRRRPDDLVVGQTTFVFDFGSEWEERLITLATLKGLEALRLVEEAGKQRVLYEQLLRTTDDPEELEDMDAENAIEVSIMPRW